MCEAGGPETAVFHNFTVQKRIAKWIHRRRYYGADERMVGHKYLSDMHHSIFYFTI